jgi:hypothetical protein
MVAHHIKLAIATDPDFEPWLERIEGLGAGFFKALLRAIPPQWIPGDEEQVSKLMWKLEERRPQLPGLLEKALMYIQARQGSRPVAVEEFLGRLDVSEPRR